MRFISLKIGFVLSIVYFVVYYLTPMTLFGPLAQFRVEMILALLILLVSLPSIPGSFVLKTPQSLALIGLACVVFLSVLFEERWVGGALHGFLKFIPSIYAYFLVCLHCNSRRKVKIVVVMTMFICLFVIAQGTLDLRSGVPQSGPAISTSTGSVDQRLWSMQHPYLLAMKNDTGQWVYRLRGQGSINDPNDFGQVLVCAIPLLFILWRPKRKLANLTCVILPVCVLLIGVYLTHSRGALLALTAVALVAARRRFGTLAGLILAGGLFVGAMALHFTGGREISAQSGSDRPELWSAGLTLLKTHPLFGVGFNQFMQHERNTAHNSVVVCAAEVGLIGFYFWSVFLYSTVRSVGMIARPGKVGEAQLPSPQVTMFPQAADKIEPIAKSEIIHLGQCLSLSLIGFLVAGWFLSRAFVTTFFLLGGMIEVAYEMARRQRMVPPRLPLSRVLMWALAVMVGLLLLVYVMLRVLNLMR